MKADVIDMLTSKSLEISVCITEIVIDWQLFIFELSSAFKKCDAGSKEENWKNQDIDNTLLYSKIFLLNHLFLIFL